jgi:hypothetical protein
VVFRTGFLKDSMAFVCGMVGYELIQVTSDEKTIVGVSVDRKAPVNDNSP